MPKVRFIQLCLSAALITAQVAVAATNQIEAVADQASLPTATPEELGYSVTHWTVEEGLPGRIITSLAQTPDGYLWCGSGDGLARYDGTHFMVFDPDEFPALKGVQPLELYYEPAGRLWIEGVDGQLVVYEGGRFRRFDESDGIPPDQAGRLGEVREGDYWIRGASDDRFYRYRRGRFEAVTFPDMPSSKIDRFMADTDGMEWAVQEFDRTIIHFNAEKTEVQRLIAPDGKSPARAGRLFWLQNGDMGVTSSHGIYALHDSQWHVLRAFTQPLVTNEDNVILDGIQDWRGNFWISVFAKGLVLSRKNGSMSLVSLPESSRQPFFRTLLFGSEGNIWVGGNDGLYRLSPYAFHSQLPSLIEARNKAAVGLVEDSNGAMWILHQSGWSRRISRGWEYTAHPYPSALLWTGCASSNGTLYLGYSIAPNSKEGYVDKVFPTGQTERLGSLAGRPLVILESRTGELWVGAKSGLWCWKSNRFERVALPQASGDYAIYGLAEDGTGQIVVAAQPFGLYRKDSKDNWRQLTTASDTGSENIWGIDVDKEGIVWVATDTGLAKWQDGMWHSYAAMRSDLPRLARSVVCDNYGNVWITSQFGVVRVERHALVAQTSEEILSLGSEWFDRSDGLPSISCADQQHALRKAADGRIWVGTLRGAAVVDPAEWQERRRRLGAPAINVEAVLADGKQLIVPWKSGDITNASEVLIPPGVSRIDIRYSVIDLTANRKNRLRYQLEGFDENWVEAGDQRVAIYRRLPPGHYRFQVNAANRYGLWNNVGASVALYVQPHWWQTFWFRIAAGLSVLGLLWFSRSVKMRQLHRERTRREEFAQRLMESQEAERKRIAGELHDSLGQDLILIKNAANQSLRKFAPSPPVQERLSEMVELASHALTNARAITSNLRPPELDRLGLTAALEAIVDKHAENSGVQFTAEIQNVNGLWPREQEINVYRIVQESVNNALKHANPHHIRLEVKVQDGQADIVLEDDGSGFDPDQPTHPGQRTGMGLTGLQERVRILGGVMELRSARGAGTSLRYRIPVPEHDRK